MLALSGGTYRIGHISRKLKCFLDNFTLVFFPALPDCVTRLWLMGYCGVAEIVIVTVLPQDPHKVNAPGFMASHRLLMLFQKEAKYVHINELGHFLIWRWA